MKSQYQKKEFLGVAFVIVFFLGVAGVAFWQFATFFVEKGIASGSPFKNAAMFPRLIAYCIVILSLIVIAQFLVEIRLKSSAPPFPPLGDARLDHDEDSGRPAVKETFAGLLLRAMASLLVFIAYLAVVPVTGYIPATILMLFILVVILGAKVVPAIIFSVGVTFSVGFIFGTVLNVVLPIGTLGLPTVF